MSGLVLNALYDIGQFSNVTPYFLLGYGRASVDTKYDFPNRGRAEIDGSSEIIQAGFGADIFFDERTTFDVKYRFRRAGLNAGGLDADIDAHILERGIRYAF
ncbi:outer membrane protein [Congregibacter litoralis]|uniref:Opacity protein n=1 Tax=Congregibacter litoralis KT71 TaxID=314285 RepID=A4AAF0_9GAMM|nr:outer membrane beta-barrel protein [Congregibacter litoralis]EAQ97027.2 Opacity protein [Congregibacter litoralis KT71]